MCSYILSVFVSLSLQIPQCLAPAHHRPDAVNEVLSDPSKSYQDRYTIFVQQKSESCFYLENMQVDYVLSVHYMVLSSTNGKQLDINMRIRDPENRMVIYQARKQEGHYVDYSVKKDGNYEICFNNKFSMYESKKVMWEVDVVGDEDKEDTKEGLDIAVNQTLQDYLTTADMVDKEII